MKKYYIFSLLSLLFISIQAQELAGDYYIPNQVSGQNGYTSLFAAINDLNSNGMSGNITFYINDDISEVNDSYLGVNTSGYTLTIKPAPATTPTIIFQNTGTTIKANLYIGSPSGLTTNLVPTHNFVIDGSNTEDGSSNDLTIIGTSLSAQKFVVQIDGNNDNITIKNTNIVNKCSNNTSMNACIWVRSISSGAPDNLTLHNNVFRSVDGHNSSGLYLASTATTPGTAWNGLTISNNLFYVSHYAMNIKFVDNAEIYNNTISVNNPASKNAAGIILQPYTNAVEGTVNIYNNNIKELVTKNVSSATNNGIMGIDNEYNSPKTVNIYNNQIAGLSTLNNTVTNSKMYGIRSTGTSTCNILHNTVYIPEMIDMESFGSSYIAGIVYGGAGETNPAGGTTMVKNNVVVSDETGMKTWLIRRVGNGGSFISENNVFYTASTTNGYIGSFNEVDIQTLENWRTESSQDTKSKVRLVNFVDAANGNLLLSGTSISDKELGVAAIELVSKDILGADRHSPLTYVGAHEPSNLNISTSIALIKKESDIRITNKDKTLEVLFEGTSQVEIYNIQGILIDKEIASNVYINTDLADGIYLIRIHGKTYKFIK